jgi:hypothetical protein
MNSIERLKNNLSGIDNEDYEAVDHEVFRYLECTIIDNGNEWRIALKLLEIIKKDLMS